ncbi:hypothetical protein ACJZ2D_011638 [Fusarium nematophilum]
MRLINVETLELETFVDDRKIPPYAILSHTWGPDGEEISFDDIQSGNIEKPGNGTKKLKGCCNQAKEDHLGYAWIDTCCIKKEADRELAEAINSMFQWYSKAFICYTYLSDVPNGDDPWIPGSKFFSSRWFERGWTLQELLAPEKLRFYDQEWASIGTKEDLSDAIVRITGIPQNFLLGWEDFRQASVAQRMSWAAKRRTSRREDTAYCLLGIFNIVMPMIYGEGDGALGRLQREIMRNTGDHSILAWGLSTAEYTPSKSVDAISAGILATSPSDFVNCGRIVARKPDATPVNTFDISGGSLRMHLYLHTTSAGETYGLLNCGPEHDAEQVVGIPVHKVVSSVAPDEYLRPQGRCSILLPRAASSTSTKPIHIQMERQSRTHEAVGQRFWLHIDGYQKINLKQVEDYRPLRRERGRVLIAEASDSDETITRQYLARFRIQGEGSRDVIVVLRVEIQRLQLRARCDVMTLSRGTALEELSQNLLYMRSEALGKQAASIGNLHVKVTVEEGYVAEERMLFVTLARTPSLPDVTVDADLELQQVRLKLESKRISQKKARARQEEERLAQQRDEKTAALDQMTKSLAAVEDQLKKLGEEEKVKSDGVKEGTEQVRRLTDNLNEARHQQDVLSRRESEIQQLLDELDTREDRLSKPEGFINPQLDSDSDYPQSSRAEESGQNTGGEAALLCAAMNGREADVRLLLEKGADLEAEDGYGSTALSLAAYKGHEAVARMLLERGADLEARDRQHGTPLLRATKHGQVAVVRLLLEKGANLDATNKFGSTPLSWAAYNGQEAVVRLLLEEGADLEATNNFGDTPLSLAAGNGHEAVVRLLLEKGADVKAENGSGKTPYQCARRNKHKIIAKLLKKSTSLETKDTFNRTPLSRALLNVQQAVARRLGRERPVLSQSSTRNSTRSEGPASEAGSAGSARRDSR